MTTRQSLFFNANSGSPLSTFLLDRFSSRDDAVGGSGAEDELESPETQRDPNSAIRMIRMIQTTTKTYGRNPYPNSAIRIRSRVCR